MLTAVSWNDNRREKEKQTNESEIIVCWNSYRPNVMMFFVRDCFWF